jgi:hypothetical protein
VRVYVHAPEVSPAVALVAVRALLQGSEQASVRRVVRPQDAARTDAANMGMNVNKCFRRLRLETDFRWRCAGCIAVEVGQTAHVYI